MTLLAVLGDQLNTRIVLKPSDGVKTGCKHGFEEGLTALKRVKQLVKNINDGFSASSDSFIKCTTDSGFVCSLSYVMLMAVQLLKYQAANIHIERSQRLMS